MDLRTYLLAALKAGCGNRLEWLQTCFAFVKDTPASKDPYPYRLTVVGGVYSTVLSDGTVVELGKRDKEGLINLSDHVELLPGDFPIVKEKMTVRVGNVLLNYVVNQDALNGKAPFMKGKVSVDEYNRLFSDKVVSNPPPGERADPGTDKIYVDEYLEAVKRIFALTSLNAICVPGASRRTMTVDPSVIQLRDKLLKENAGKLHDLTVVAKIDKELTAADKASFVGDSSEGFFTASKQFDVIRKRSHILVGGEAAFISETGTVDFIPTSLSDGWDLSKMPAMVNSLREGSYSRGSLTALGGEAVKFFNRVFANITVIPGDCGTRLGLPVQVTRDSAKGLVGFYHLVNGRAVGIKEGDESKYIGKTLIMRSPLYCATPGVDYCATCMGDVNAANPTGMGAAVSSIGSQFMGIFMKKMHGKAVKSAPIDLDKAIR